jgi:hypothetical protein
VTSYRVRTIAIGRNLPAITQHLPTKPVLDAVPLLTLMLNAGATLFEAERILVLAGPVNVPPATRRTAYPSPRS